MVAYQHEERVKKEPRIAEHATSARQRVEKKLVDFHGEKLDRFVAGLPPKHEDAQQKLQTQAPDDGPPVYLKNSKNLKHFIVLMGCYFRFVTCFGYLQVIHGMNMKMAIPNSDWI